MTHHLSVFIGSASEQERFAEALTNEINEHKEAIQLDLLAENWSGSLTVGENILNELQRKAQDADLAILIAGGDDFVTSRGIEMPSIRDNVVFELGLFIGALGSRRVWLIRPAGAPAIKIPTDYNGIVYKHYRSNLEPKASMRALAAEAIQFLKREPPKRCIPTMEEMIGCLKEAVVDLSQLADTRPIGVFPGFFREHVQRLVSQSSHLQIATEVLPVGGFSDSKTSVAYLEALNNPQRCVELITPTEAFIRSSVERQLPTEHWAAFSHQHRRELDTYRLMRVCGAIDSAARFYEETIRHHHDAVALFRENGSSKGKAANSGFTHREIEADLPLHMWISDRTEAVFSIPMDVSSDRQSREEFGFYTRSKELIRGLSALWYRLAELS